MKLLKETVERFLLNRINVDRYLPLQLDITNSCNLRCVHCYHPHHKNDGAISLNEWKEIVDQYQVLVTKMLYRPCIMLCGGEPFTSPYLFPLMTYIRERIPTARISILTNGTMVSDSIISDLKNFEGTQFQVSLDGPDTNRHDIIRGKGNFEKAIRGIRKLRAAGFEVHAQSVLSKKTSVWMEDFFKLSQQEKFASMNFVRFVPEGYGRKLVESSEDEPLLGSDLEAAYQKLLECALKYGVKTKTHGPLFELVMPGLGRSGRFWESIVVDYQGYIVASSRSKLRLGSVLHEGLEEIFLKHPIYNALRKGRVDVCGSCKLFNVCGGDRNAAYSATGNFLGHDPGCWKHKLNQKGRAL